MIKLKTNTEKFIDILDILASSNDEIEMDIKEDGIFFRIVDRSNVSLGLITVNKNFFDEYNFVYGKYTIDLNIFLTIIKRLKKNEITIESSENAFVIQSGKSEFKLKFYASSEDERAIPSPPFNSIWKMNSSDFFELIEDYSSFSNIAKFEAKEELSTYTKSNLLDGKVISEAEKIESVDCEVFYDISYLMNIVKMKKMFKQMTFSFGEVDKNPLPCKIEAENENIKLLWFLGPRVRGEDE